MIDVLLQARRFAALGDPTRLQVFAMLSREATSVSRIAGALPISRPAVSQHLRVLADAGLVDREPRGTQNIYRPNPEAVASMRSTLDVVWDVALARFAAEAAAVHASRSAPVASTPKARRPPS